MIPPRLEAYRDVAPRGTLELLARLAERLRGRRFVHVNASRYGGGSPELLNRLVPMMQELGIDSAWEVIVGDPEFYAAIRALESAAAGREQEITADMLRSYEETSAVNSPKLSLDADLVMIHDLAPLPLVRHRRNRGRWVWRCHSDLSQALRRVWHLLRRDVARYDATVFSLPKFAQRVPAGKADYAVTADVKGYKSLSGKRLQAGPEVTVHIDNDERADNVPSILLPQRLRTKSNDAVRGKAAFTDTPALQGAPIEHRHTVGANFERRRCRHGAS